MAKHKTARGKEFNMAAFSQTNGSVTAVGNVRRNGAGDLLDEKNRVIATAKEIQTSYYNSSPSAVKSAGIKEDNTMPTVIQTEAPKTQSKSSKKAAADSVESVKEYTGETGELLKEVTYLDGSIEVVKA